MKRSKTFTPNGNCLKKNKENKTKRSETIEHKEKDWSNSLDDLFDIAYADALETIKIEEDRQFLLAQRQKGRPGKMIGVDKVLHKKETEKLLKEKKYLKRKYEEELNRAEREETVELSTTGSSDDDTDCTTDENDNISMPRSSEASNVTSKTKRQKCMLDEKLSASLDMAKLSNRKAALVLTHTLQSAGVNPESYSVSYSSIRRQREDNRTQIAGRLKSEFSANMPLTVHWYGQLLEYITGKETVDRLPVLISGLGVDQLLGVPKLLAGTGEAMAAGYS